MLLGIQHNDCMIVTLSVSPNKTPHANLATMMRPPLLQLLLILSLLVVGAWSVCGECDQSLCPDNSSCNTTTLDECDCCRVCVR